MTPDEYRRRPPAAGAQSGVSLLNHRVTTNHTHLLVEVALANSHQRNDSSLKWLDMAPDRFRALYAAAVERTIQGILKGFRPSAVGVSLPRGLRGYRHSTA